MNIFDELKGKLIVSCQAEGDDPFNDPESILRFARAALMGGAAGIRSEGREKLIHLRSELKVPLIGLIKSEFEDGYVCISRRWEDIQTLTEIGVDIIAVDGTFRLLQGRSGPELISRIRSNYPECLIMADIATVEEAEACLKSGAHCISTTLSGYTPQTSEKGLKGPDLQLLRELAVKYPRVPLFAEGRYNSPESAGEALKCRAWTVVTGTAVTRPRVISSWFVKALEGKNEI